LNCSIEPEAKDCAGIEGGSAYLDDCEQCVGGTTGNVANYLQDCSGECGGLADNCLGWVDCPSCYENTSSMTAIVLDTPSGTQMYDENDILAAFDTYGNVRGIALHLYPIPFGPHEGTGLYEIQVRADEAGDAIIFKYYDKSEDEVLDSGTGYTFVIDDIIGDVVVPHAISVNN